MELLQWPGDKLHVGPWVTLQGHNWTCRQNLALIKYETGLPAGMGSRRVYLWVWCAVHMPECKWKHKSHCVWANGGEWVEVVASGYWEQRYRYYTLWWGFAVVYFSSFSPAKVCCDPLWRLKLQPLHLFKAFFKECTENTCPKGARHILQNGTPQELETFGLMQLLPGHDVSCLFDWDQGINSNLFQKA